MVEWQALRTSTASTPATITALSTSCPPKWQLSHPDGSPKVIPLGRNLPSSRIRKLLREGTTADLAIDALQNLQTALQPNPSHRSKLPINGVLALQLATRGAFRIPGSIARAQPRTLSSTESNASLVGLLKVVAAEQPHLECCTTDIALETPSGVAEASVKSFWADMKGGEFIPGHSHVLDQHGAVLCGGIWLAPRLLPDFVVRATSSIRDSQLCSEGALSTSQNSGTVTSHLTSNGSVPSNILHWNFSCGMKRLSNCNLKSVCQSANSCCYDEEMPSFY